MTAKTKAALIKTLEALEDNIVERVAAEVALAHVLDGRSFGGVLHATARREAALTKGAQLMAHARGLVQGYVK